MQNTEAPGVIPEWKAKLEALTRAERYDMANKLGVSERSILNWINDKNSPNAATIAAITRKGKR